ncbi:unnamed protein product [Linum tenue]|uniref:Cardiomyopathy-associated protein 5 n=1 Tax=Linum tenue TaxID=586396 RepID=A0AAV0PZ72_9ROSI|nr:unnamed protein product [Linum tenue]
MGLDVKAIVITICKFSFKSMCKCVKKYPILSGLMCIIFLIYVFNPSIFVFLIYTSPLIVVTTLLYRLYLKRRKSKNVINKERKIEKYSISSTVGGKTKSVESDRPVPTKPTRSMSQRRNKEKFFVDADPTTSQEIKASISDFLMAAAPTTNLDLLDKVGFTNERDTNDESRIMKEHQEGQGSLDESKDSLLDGETLNHDNHLSDFPLKSRHWVKGIGGEDFGSSEEDAEIHEDRNHAVEWNEDDQKNLMDLGISEIERNKRLESLIARRREKKLFKMKTEKGMVDINIGPCSSPSASTTSIIAPVFISRNDPIHVSHGLIEDQFPGSAPSILLPGKNPFDLPYDPHEEKLDLMADSFQQEFSITPHKEMFMCRHESFSLGPHFPLPGILDGKMGHPKPSLQFGNTDEQKPSWNKDSIARTVSVTDLVTDLVETEEPNQSPGKTSSIEEKESKVDSKMTIDHIERIKEKNLKEAINKTEIPTEGNEISPNPRPPALPRPIPKAASASDLSNDASLSIIHHTRVDDHYPNKASWHTPTNSVASDLQVEVSEVSSPPSTVDGADTDDDKSLTYDADIEKEINSGSEELWGLSPHAPKIGKHELALRFLDEASEEGMRKTWLSTRAADESISAATSPVPLEMKSQSQVRSKDLDGEIKSDVKQVEKESVSELLIKGNVGQPTTENEDIVPLPDSEETLDSLHEATKVETMINHDTGEVDGKDKKEELRSIEQQTIYEIKDNELRPIEELSLELDSNIERELLQGPEKVADVIVKRTTEQTDGSRSTQDLIGTTEQLHHEEAGEKLVTLDPSIDNNRFVSAQLQETSRSLEDIEDLRENTGSLEVGAKKIESSSSSKSVLPIQPNIRIEEDITDSSFNTTPGNHSYVPTQADETLRSTEEVKNCKEDIRSENIQQILESGETQLTTSIKNDEETSDSFEAGVTGMNLSSMSTTSLPMQPELAVDDELINQSSLLSPVSVLIDMNQATQLSPSPIREQRHNVDNLVFQSEQNPLTHNSLNEQPLLENSTTFSTAEQPHRSTSSDEAGINNLEMDNDQRHDPQSPQWNNKYIEEMKPATLIENMCSSDSGTTIGTCHMQEISKSPGDDDYSPNSAAHVEVAIENVTKGEANGSHTTPEEKVENKISRDLLEENKIVTTVTDNRNEGESLFSITQEPVAEPSNPNNIVSHIHDRAESMSIVEQNCIVDPLSITDLNSSTSIASESLSPIKQEDGDGPLIEANLISSTDIRNEIIDSIRHEPNANPLNPVGSIPSNTFEDESSSSIEPEAITESLKEAALDASNNFEDSFVSITQDAEEEPLNSTNCASLEPIKGGLISPLREEAIAEPLEQATPYDFGGKSMEKISQEIISKQQEPAEPASSKPLEKESLSSTQHEGNEEKSKACDFISSNVLDSESTSLIEEEVISKSSKLSNSISEEPLRQGTLVEPPKPTESGAFVSESLSSMMQAAIEESSQLDNLISSNTIEGVPLSSMKEEVVLEQPKPIDSSSSTTLKSDSLLSIQQEASAEPHNWVSIEVHDEKSLSSIKEEAITQEQKLAEAVSSMNQIQATNPLQSELLHVDPSKSTGETKNSGVNINGSHEQNMAVKIDNIHSSEANDDSDQTTNKQEEIIAQPTGNDDLELKGENQNKGNFLIIPSQPQLGESAPT